jgi:hypothetical protein
MTRRRKVVQRVKQSSVSPSSPYPNRRQRRRIRRRRQQRRMKILNHSSSMTTQIATDALNRLQISNELNIKPLDFIERYELTRHHALTMPLDQRPIVFFLEHSKSRMLSNTTSELYSSMDEDYYSSYV